jgi:hypothetical protein
MFCAKASDECTTTIAYRLKFWKLVRSDYTIVSDLGAHGVPLSTLRDILDDECVCPKHSAITWIGFNRRIHPIKELIQHGTKLNGTTRENSAIAL